jgi:hypothetical protein
VISRDVPAIRRRRFSASRKSFLQVGMVLLNVFCELVRNRALDRVSQNGKHVSTDRALPFHYGAALLGEWNQSGSLQLSSFYNPSVASEGGAPESLDGTTTTWVPSGVLSSSDSMISYSPASPADYGSRAASSAIMCARASLFAYLE